MLGLGSYLARWMPPGMTLCLNGDSDRLSSDRHLQVVKPEKMCCSKRGFSDKLNKAF